VLINIYVFLRISAKLIIDVFNRQMANLHWDTIPTISPHGCATFCLRKWGLGCRVDNTVVDV